MSKDNGNKQAPQWVHNVSVRRSQGALEVTAYIADGRHAFLFLTIEQVDKISRVWKSIYGFLRAFATLGIDNGYIISGYHTYHILKMMEVLYPEYKWDKCYLSELDKCILGCWIDVSIKIGAR